MKDNTKKTLKYFLKGASNYKIAGLVVVLAVIGNNVLGSVVPLFFKNFFNLLVSNQTKEVIVNGLLMTLLIIAILNLSQWICGRTTDFAINYFESKIMADLNKQCFAYLHQHSFAYFSNNFTGSMVKRIKSFTNAFEVLCDQLFYQLLPTFVTIMMITFILARLNIFLGLGMFLWVVLIILINWIFVKFKLKYDIQRSEAETNTTGYLSDTISNNTNIKLFNGFNFEVKGFSDLTDKLQHLRIFTWNLWAKFASLQSFLIVVLEVGIFYFAIRLWNKNIITVGDFVLIQSYVLTVIMMAWNFGNVIRKIYEYLAEAEEMTVILETSHEVVDIENANDLEVNFGGIKFNNVGFTYDGGNKVVDKFNLEIKPKETIAVVGSSGAGKTTLVKLLLRIYDIQNGRILIDSQDISKVTQESLRNNVSLVPQDPILFHRSLMENIRYGKMDATDEEVVEAAKLAHCDEFIGRLKLGYDTFVGERGIKLSGGERQRVAIARAILRNAPILILDEATSSLDSESEMFIQDSLDKLMDDKTVIVIAHRLSTIKKVDRIVVIDNKKIVEDGTHNELAKIKNGLYRKLWDIQIGGFIK
jgi:ATP-binding cassette subfamily B protein